MPSVLVEDHAAARILTLNRPEKRNAANLEMQRFLLEQLIAAHLNPSTRAIIITGSGSAFSAGGDRRLLTDILAGTSIDRDELSRINVETAKTMLSLRVPAIAAVNGAAVGYAAGIVALCDFVIMGQSAFLSDPHVQFGLAPAWATQQVWPRLSSGLVARELLLTGRCVYGEEALRLGLCTQVCPDGAERETALSLAEELGKLPPEGLAATKQALNHRLLNELDCSESKASS